MSSALPELSRSETDPGGLYYLSDHKWKTRDIPVCWVNGGFAAEKLWVKEMLRGQRSWSKTGNVNFVGWGACNPYSPDMAIVPQGIRITIGTQNESELGTTDGNLYMQLDFSANAQDRWKRCKANKLTREQCIRSTALHEFGHALSFAHEQNRDDTPATCTEEPQGEDGDSTYGAWDASSLMNYCANARDLSAADRRGADRAYGQAYGDSRRLGDFNDDGVADLLCHDTVTGQRWLSFANTEGKFHGTSYQVDSSWCAHDTGRLFKGDFNGDGNTDALCHDVATGTTWIDYADLWGRLNTTDYQINNGWCAHQGGRLYVGDFNADGRDDLLCHDVTNGDRFIDYADSQGHFGVTDFVRKDGWCDGKYGRLYIGDFDNDGRDDQLCHDSASGDNYIDYAYQGFYGTDFHFGGFCNQTTSDFYVGDFNGDARDDVLCHDSSTGEMWIDYNEVNGIFQGVNWYRKAQWCNDATERLYIGRANLDTKDDLICHNVRTGEQKVDLASPLGQFLGQDNNTSIGWCGHTSGEVH